MKAGSLPERPVLTTPNHLRAKEVRDAIGARVARQPGLGFAGLLLVVPVAVLFAVGAGGAENSLVLFAPLVSFALPVIAMIAFWWEDWLSSRAPCATAGSRLRPPCYSPFFSTCCFSGTRTACTGRGRARMSGSPTPPSTPKWRPAKSGGVFQAAT